MKLTVKNLLKKFENKTIFEDFSYEFENKGLYIIRGKSGKGKTTLLRIISGLDCDYSGTVEGGGLGSVSVCFQEHRLFPWLNALENVAIADKCPDREITTQKAKKILTRLDFAETDMLLRPDALSGGMKQRVAFARALIKDAPILILDEVTKELNEDLAQKVLDIINEESKKRLVLLVTHRDSEKDAVKAKYIDI